MLMLVSNLTYSQYPIAKKIGEDSVIIMTLKQGNEINSTFLKLKDSINSLKNGDVNSQLDDLMSLQRMYNSYSHEYFNRKIEQSRYDSLLNEYNKKDEIHRRQIRGNVIIASIFSILVLFLRL
jgi:hypothetical protein